MTLSRRDLILSASAALLGSSLPAWSAGVQTLHGRAFGSSWTFVTAGPIDAPAVRAGLEEIVASVDHAMSPFLPESELSRFNRAATTDWQPLSSASCAVIGEGLRIAALTENAFNPTIGPLVGRYGFGPIREGLSGTPDEISVHPDAARKARPELSLDLCGIAKGHALDRMTASCVGLGLTDFLIELGGEVFATGRHPSGRSWQVGIERPSPEGGFQRAVALDGISLATSGNAVNTYAWRGRDYGHIIDPIKAKPADTALASVTVAAPAAMTADGLATALFAMGPDRGPAFAGHAGIEALFIMADGREIATSAFAGRILA